MNNENKAKLKNFIERANAEYENFNQKQLATKILINSMYGAHGAKTYRFSNVDVATSITTQAKASTLYAEKCINDFFTNDFQNHKEIHKALGININPNYSIKNKLVIYIDTDTIFSDACVTLDNDVIKVTDDNNVTHIYNPDDIVKVKRNNSIIDVRAEEITENDSIENSFKLEYTNKLTLEELYGLGKQSMGNTLAGHESVSCDYKLLNVIDNKVVFNPVKRVIRHLLNKDKWEIVSEDGNKIIVTDDHSLIVKRDNKLIKMKAHEINILSDILISINKNKVLENKIKSCKCVGKFKNEYGYDIEMDDDSHTFVANNILVHNSCYTQYDEVIKNTDWMQHKVWKLTKVKKSNEEKTFKYVSSSLYPDKEAASNFFNEQLGEDVNIEYKEYYYTLNQIEPDGREFTLALNDIYLKKFFDDKFELFSKYFNTDNLYNFELETYSDSGIWLAKKKYLKNILWSDPDVYYDSLSNISATGVSIVQGWMTKWCKKEMRDLIKWIFAQKDFKIEALSKEVAKIRKKFEMQPIYNITVTKSMNGYEDYVVDDNSEMICKSKTPATVKGALLHNYILNNNIKLKKKYNLITAGQKICMVYIKPKKNSKYNIKMLPSDIKLMQGDSPKTEIAGCISFLPGIYIDEITDLEIDYEKQFNLCFLNTINSIIKALGYPEFQSAKTFVPVLF